MDERNIEQFLQFADLAADAAAGKTLPRFRANVAVDNKKEDKGFDPVTVADREAEEAIRELIEHHFPDHGIIGEEFGTKEADGPYSWTLDPIDGTRSFISGVPLWGTLIALCENGNPVIGLMDQPFTGERWVGFPGGAEYRRAGAAVPLSAAPCDGISHARFGTTDPEMFTGRDEIEVTRILRERARVRRYGGDCYFYCLVAAGEMDAVVESGLQPYDIHALIPIIEGAGGRVTAWNGGSPLEGGQILATGDDRVHVEAIELLSSATRP